MNRRIVLLFACLAALFAISSAAAQEPAPAEARNEARNEAARQLQKLIRVYQYLHELYVDDVEMAPLVEQAVTGMLDALDPHSAYLGAEEMREAEERFEGAFSGIGIEYTLLRDTVVVANTIAGGPAEQVGVRPNDRIVRIDSLDAVGFKQSDVTRHLRGERGTRVAVEIVRPGEAHRLRFDIVRDNIPLHTIDAVYTVADTIGYIKVNRFGRTTMEEFRDAFARLGDPGAVILDLRGNGGGLLDQAIEMAGFFLPSGARIVSTEGRALPPRVYYAQTDGGYVQGPLVVLLDEVSASASEIVAGAIQDWDRGVVIGRPSFGKGLVQRQIMLGDGSALRLTVARYHTPSGRVIQRPYREGHRREYYLDRLRPDSTAASDSASAPAYRTLRTGRTVYGGGGIWPDIEVPADTTGYTAYYAALIRCGAVNEFVAATMDSQRDALMARYPDFGSFHAGYLPSDELLAGLAALGAERGVAANEAAFAQSKPLMQLQIKALVGRRLFGDDAFYRVMNDGRNDTYRRAVEVLGAWEEEGAALLLRGN